MTKRQILALWMKRYGDLSAASRDRFLKRTEVGRLARYPDDVVRQAIAFSNMLGDALAFAHSAYEGEPRELPPEPGRSDASTPPAPPPRPLRSDVNAALRRQLGPTQHYDDGF
jgi:hypothetical protein